MLKSVKKNRKFSSLLLIALLLTGGATVVYAINTVSDGFQITTAQRTIDAHGTCRKVVKTSGNDVFAPTRTAAEWSAFISNKPASVNLGQCCSGTLYAGYCWYIGADNQSCTSVCSSHGGVNRATHTYSGSGGSSSQCFAVLAALGHSYTTYVQKSSCMLECAITGSVSDYRHWCPYEAQYAEKYDYSSVNARRLCACNE